MAFRAPSEATKEAKTASDEGGSKSENKRERKLINRKRRRVASRPTWRRGNKRRRGDASLTRNGARLIQGHDCETTNT